MAIVNRIAGFADDMRDWRHHIHAHPELGLDCFETADFVVARLKEFGVDEIHTEIGKTGVVAIIKGQGDGPVTGLRADMDALPIQEETGAAHASTVPGKMHACGHDGHTTMLLGAAKYLAETRNFSGKVALIFQPAEEGEGGADAMIADGLMKNFGISEVYGLHTNPYTPFGNISMRPGPAMAGCDEFSILIQGKGGHAARPDVTKDPVPAIFQIGQAIQSISARNIPAIEHAVISVTTLEAGKAFNVVPHTAKMGGTVRCFSPDIQNLIESRIAAICAGVSEAMDVTATLNYRRLVKPVINDPGSTAFAAEVARDVSGAEQVNDEFDLILGSEDFGAMLLEKPGAFVFLGQGEGPGLHHPEFDFNDEVAPVGSSYLARLVEMRQPL
ncbi:MAG: M20 aminoacylase family protein [Pseudomonadota bacterium]